MGTGLNGNLQRRYLHSQCPDVTVPQKASGHVSRFLGISLPMRKIIALQDTRDSCECFPSYEVRTTKENGWDFSSFLSKSIHKENISFLNRVWSDLSKINTSGFKKKKSGMRWQGLLLASIRNDSIEWGKVHLKWQDKINIVVCYQLSLTHRISNLSVMFSSAAVGLKQALLWPNI